MEKDQYHFPRIHISNNNCNMAITCMASSPGTDMALKCLPSWGSTVLPCHGDHGPGIKMENDSPKATLECRLRGGTRFKQRQLERTMHFRKSLLFKPSIAWSFRAPRWCAKKQCRGAWVGTNQVISGLENNASCWHRLYSCRVLLQLLYNAVPSWSIISAGDREV